MMRWYFLCCFADNKNYSFDENFGDNRDEKYGENDGDDDEVDNDRCLHVPMNRVVVGTAPSPNLTVSQAR